MQTQPLSASLLFDDLHDGQVEELSWGSSGTPSDVSIDAAGVRTAVVYYGRYTFDGETLSVTAPTTDPLPPSDIVPNDPAAPLIETLTIDTWGSHSVDPPLQFAGPPTGTMTFSFRQRTGVSGPIGSGSGP